MDETNKAVVIVSKCGEAHKTYGIRAEKKEGGWSLTWAFPIKEATANREGYDETSIGGGNISLSEEYPGCPYCGRKAIVVCTCGRVGCQILKRRRYTCEWCGEKSFIVSYSGTSIRSGGNM